VKNVSFDLCFFQYVVESHSRGIQGSKPENELLTLKLKLETAALSTSVLAWFDTHASRDVHFLTLITRLVYLMSQDFRSNLRRAPDWSAQTLPTCRQAQCCEASISLVHNLTRHHVLTANTCHDAAYHGTFVGAPSIPSMRRNARLGVPLRI
jgi:hypothetical protein